MNGHRIAKLVVTFTVAFGSAFVAPEPPLMADSQVPIKSSRGTSTRSTS